MVILTITNIIMFVCAAILFSCNRKMNSIIKKRSEKIYEYTLKLDDLYAEHSELLRKVKTLESIDALKFDSMGDYKDAIRKITVAYERQHNCDIKQVTSWDDGEVNVKM